VILILNLIHELLRRGAEYARSVASQTAQRPGHRLYGYASQLRIRMPRSAELHWLADGQSWPHGDLESAAVVGARRCPLLTGLVAGSSENVFEKPACGPQTSAIPQVPAALGGPLRASQTHSEP
jgi:hypothetical protein